MSKLLALMDIREVYLDDGNLSGRNGVADGDTVMRKGSGIQDNVVRVPARCLNGIHQDALVIRLQKCDGKACTFRAAAQAFVDVGECQRAVNLRLT